MLSNKLTFSLASLVVIIAIGLIFGVTPAIGQTDITFTVDGSTTAGSFIVVVPTGTVSNNMIDAAAVGPESIDTGTWEDLTDFFINGGGTIQLIGPTSLRAGFEATDSIFPQVEKEIVISEIMWGSDLNPGTGETAQGSQWIELYVRVASGTADETWTLRFTANELVRDAPGAKIVTDAGADAAVTTDDTVATLVDVMSNWGLGFWAIAEDGAYGQSGNEAEAAEAPAPAIPAKRRISMYRDIDYKGAMAAEAAAKKATAAEAAATTAAATTAAKTTMTAEMQKVLDAMKDGTRAGNWKKSAAPRGANQNGTVFASPGEPHFQGFVAVGDTTVVARAGVVFNEIANRTAAKDEWIELHNRGTAAVNVVNYTVSMVSGDPSPTATNDDGAQVSDPAADVLLFKITHPDGDAITIPAGGYLLLVNTDPAETDLLPGTNVTNEDSLPRVNNSYYVGGEKLNLPDTAGYTLILRTELKAGSHEKIADIAVGNGGYFGLLDNDPVYNTDVWPLKSAQADAKDDLAMHANTWVRDHAKALFNGDAWKNGDAPSKFTGVGVGRNSTSTGTPGFANDSVKAEFADADGKASYTGTITISEVMFAQTRRNLPQWIELFNSSMTQAINIKGWELEIQNVESDDLDAREEVSFKITGDQIVAPRQTVLIVSTTSSNRSDNIPDAYSLYTNHRTKLEMTRRNDSVLSLEGFYISLSDARGVEADSIGNIDSDGVVEWELPMAEDGRSSITRRYDNGVAEDGTLRENWVLTSETDDFSDNYYGRSSDIGSPGDRKGTALPVSLSSFRPMRDQATGEVVIRWITQSELNNAGFNILRSETKKGEFKVVNLKGIIAGHGTTSEKHVYEWKDTTAKPNVVYYYQIEDVSLDGKRTRLATTHLRGNVNAAGKATIRWGELKSQR